MTKIDLVDAFYPCLDYRPTVIPAPQLEIWLRDSRPGDRIVYAVASHLGRDHPDSPVPALARSAYRAGLVILVQRRLGPMRHEYIAVRRDPPAKVPLRMAGDIPDTPVLRHVADCYRPGWVFDRIAA